MSSSAPVRLSRPAWIRARAPQGPGYERLRGLMRGLELHGVTPGRIFSANSADTILGFVESGLGFSLVPFLDPAGPRAKGIASRPLRAPKVEFPVYAAWRLNAPQNPVLDAFLEVAPKP